MNKIYTFLVFLVLNFFHLNFCDYNGDRAFNMRLAARLISAIRTNDSVKVNEILTDPHAASSFINQLVFDSVIPDKSAGYHEDQCDHSISVYLTPLIYAIRNGNSSMVKMLLNNGADYNSAGQINWYYFPCQRHHLQGSVTREKSPKTSRSMNYYPYDEAVKIGNNDIIQLLIHKSRGNLLNADGTILIKAVKERDIAKIKDLKKLGADFNFKSIDGTSPLITAITLSDIDIIKLLINDGADVNFKDFFGMAPLMYAAGLGNADIVTLLLYAGADVNAKNNLGKTAEMLALEKNKGDVVKLLAQRSKK